MTSDAVVVPVVAACIVQLATPSRGELVLLSKRLTAREPSTLGKWEFPGGVVHFGEKLEDAIKREILEELNLSIVPRRLLHAQINTYDSGVDYLVVFFECNLVDKAESYAESYIGSLQWVRPESIIKDGWDTLPGTVEAAKRLWEER